MIKGLLLDFYGTVVEEDDEVVAAICDRVATGAVTAAEFGALWTREFRAGLAAAYRPQHEIAVASLAAALAAAGSGADPAALFAEQSRFARTAPLRPGSREFLARVEVPVCIVSNIDRPDLQAALDHHGLSFAAVVTSDDVGAYKPSPVIFQRALDLLGLQAGEVLHVGDSLSADVAGARAAGIRPVWVNRKGGPVPEGVTEVIRNLAELPRPAAGGEW